MKFLIVPVPSAGHLLAMVPFCWALRLAGHEILVASRAEVVATAQRAGLDAADLPELAVPMDTLRNQVNPSMFPVPAFADREAATGRGLWEVAARRWHQHAEQFLAPFARVAREWGAQVIVTDPLATLGRVLAAELGVPVVSHRWGIDPTGGPFTESTTDLLARTPGAEPVAVLDICPPGVQAPDAVPGTPMRFVPFNGTGMLPPQPVPDSRRPRVVVCFGGSVLALTGSRPLRAVVDALARVPEIDVVVAASAADRALLGATPDHVRVLEQVPLQLFLPGSDLLIHHGGSTTGLTACRYGVSQLVLPQMFDQFDYARGIVRVGAGIAAEDAVAQADIDGLADSVRTLLDTPGYRAAAGAVAAALRDTPAPATVADAVVELLGDRVGLAA
ncbi:glycosyltransferase [Nocardia puris]|uniref:Glycosyltransferase/glycosyltransferase n=1 Tax=Nocardia puris TaxID=208602 RepID=A0A366DJ97_9NOCA|nr:nucleotide disphospho-sugar-binding domain-containing protein [Nocardia puris]RBO90160.1 glycosyltransferase/glycosyltransferase [Nocardia puris]